MVKKGTKILQVLLLFTVFGIGCVDQRTATPANPIRGSINLDRVLSWLPANTEALLVANGPFWMPNFQTGQDNLSNSLVTSEELDKQFEGMTLGLFNAKDGLLGKRLERKKVLFAMEGSRRFRPPKGLGEMPFEGCALAIFKDDLGDLRDAFMKDAASNALRIQEIEGNRVAVFEEPSELDTLTTYVTFPQEGVVLVASNEQFLREMLVRMRGVSKTSERALPDSLPEWKYVNKGSKFWGLRHYDREQAKEDPTSPFGERKSANIPDDAAVGLTYNCDPSTRKKATLTYLSGTWRFR
jgi:hypothetical protein